ncbi:hypothetical protein BG005_007136 [Podila minutissima]|nr:hypothetical protein BG005_007136 [Podila minutissima]
MSLTSDDNSQRTTLSTPLPEECIQHIFEFLHRDISTLHSLIRVSKTFFRIAVPLLYSSPFDLLESNQSWSPHERTKRHAPLLFLLMNCSLQDQDQDQDQKLNQSIWIDLPPVCSTFRDTHWRLRRPLVDYLALYHHHYLGMNLSSTFPIIFPNIQQYSPPSSSQSLLLNTTITMFTRNEIEKRFLLHQPDQIKTVSLPIQRFAAFKPIVAQLCGLVRFELLGVSWHFDLTPAIDFVHQHSDMYGTIRELKMTGPHDVRALQKPTLIEMVKAIRHPRELDLSRYKEATKDLNSYEFQNIAGVETLLFNLDYIPPVSASPSTLQPNFPPPGPAFASVVNSLNPHHRGLGLLDSSTDRTLDEQDNSLRVVQACTGLRHLQIGVNSATAFSWALDKFNTDPDSVMPLQVLHISSNTTAIIKRALEDCLRAFQYTLRDLKGISLKLSAAPLLNPSFGWDWPLNHLTTLSLKGELAVWFDMRSLEFCPKLQELNLTLHPFSPPDPDHLSKVVLAPHLKTLSLVGRWSMTDSVIAHFGAGLLRLEKLVLDRCQCDDLSVDGLLQGLDQMTQLKTLQVALEECFESALKKYGLSRPELKISGDGEWVVVQQ